MRHIIFWLVFMALYVIRDMLFAGPSDLAYPVGQRILRFFSSELLLIPWKITPFYVLFYVLIPRYFRKGAYLRTALYLMVTLLVCIAGYRSMVGPISEMLYSETPDFNVYSFRRFLYTLTDLLPALGVASTIKLLKGTIRSQAREAALQHEKRVSELNFLKAQTNSHFLFNTLNNLYGLARRNDPNAADSILKLSTIVRYILQECDTTLIPIEKEIKVIRDYLALERLRYDERLQIDFTVQVDDPSLKIPPLILLPFVENAFKHGVSETRDAAFIDITLKQCNEVLTFCVRNSRNENDEPEGDGIGLKNVKRHLSLIYDGQYALGIKPESDVFTVELMIQLDQVHE